MNKSTEELEIIELIERVESLENIAERMLENSQEIIELFRELGNICLVENCIWDDVKEKLTERGLARDD